MERVTPAAGDSRLTWIVPCFGPELNAIQEIGSKSKATPATAAIAQGGRGNASSAAQPGAAGLRPG